MSDPAVLFSKFGSESLLGEMTDDDKLLLETTMTEDRIMGALLTPGEFVSMWSSRQGKESCEQVIDRIKKYSFGRLEARIESVGLQWLQLLSLLYDAADDEDQEQMYSDSEDK